jgi:hypothetical protein
MGRDCQFGRISVGSRREARPAPSFHRVRYPSFDSRPGLRQHRRLMQRAGRDHQRDQFIGGVPIAMKARPSRFRRRRRARCSTRCEDTIAGLSRPGILSVGLQVGLRRAKIAALKVGDLHQKQMPDKSSRSRRAPNTHLWSRGGPRVRRLAAGGRRIRTIGTAVRETAVDRCPPAPNHRCLARRPVLNDPIQLVGLASPFGNRATAERPFRKSGTDGSNPVPSSADSANYRFRAGLPTLGSDRQQPVGL